MWDGSGVAVEEVAAPAPREGWARVDVGYTGLCGTDLHIVAGEHPRARPPLVLGHEVVGALAEPGAGLPRGAPVVVNPLLACGRCPACRRGAEQVCARLGLIGIDAPGGLADQVAVPVGRLVPVPDGAPLRRVAFAEPLAVAVRAVRRSRLTLGERALVVGAGPIGLAVAACARLAGAGEVLVMEPAPTRRALADALGLTLLDAAQPGEDLGERTQGEGAEVVFDCAGRADVARRLGAWTAPEGRVVVVAVYGGEAPVDLRRANFAELELIGTRVYSGDDLATAIGLLARGVVDAEPLVSATVGLEGAPVAFARLREGREVKVLVAGPAAEDA